MKIRRIAALLLAVVMTISSPELLKAQENEVSTENEMIFQNIEEVQNPKLATDVTLPDISLENGEFLGSLGEISTFASPNSITQTIPGIINEEDGLAYLNIGLSTNDILHATMECPNNSELDYDLYLYKYDEEGNLTGPVAESRLATHQNTENGILKTVDESISYINTTSSYTTYALVVHAKVGCSDVDGFNLTISIDEGGYYDTIEPNDSPYAATDLGAASEVNVSGANLNVSNDIDWYCWKAPLTTGQIQFSTGNSNYEVKVYSVSQNGAMVLEDSSNGQYALVPNSYYYIRVANIGSNFVSSTYNLESEIVNADIVTNIRLVFEGDMGDALADYKEGKLERFDDWMKVGVFVETAGGYGIANMPVIVQWISESGEVVTFWTKTGDGSSTSVSGYMPEAVGYRTSAAPVSTHVYDLDTIRAFCGSGTAEMKVYHYKYSY